MKRLSVVLIALGFIMTAALPAAMAGDPEDISDWVKKIKAGKGVNEVFEYPKNHIQKVKFKVELGFHYIIDIKAQLCFVSRSEKILVSCKAVKKGYPLVAPLITWEN